MGISILELVLQELRNAEFRADVAFPGQKYPPITETVAAVHIQKVDRAGLTVTVEVNILCPAAMGGTACEVEALRATEVLRWAGAECIQNGCQYDGMAQVYCVDILATFTCITEAEDCAMGPGFSVYLNDLEVPYVVVFTAEEKVERELMYEIGENAPVGITDGKRVWAITLEELIPAGSVQLTQLTDCFKVRVEKSNGHIEIYYDCYWNSESRSCSREGLRRVRKGTAMWMGEMAYG